VDNILKLCQMEHQDAMERLALRSADSADRRASAAEQLRANRVTAGQIDQFMNMGGHVRVIGPAQPASAQVAPAAGLNRLEMQCNPPDYEV
jgi:hypothetical protein